MLHKPTSTYIWWKGKRKKDEEEKGREAIRDQGRRGYIKRYPHKKEVEVRAERKMKDKRKTNLDHLRKDKSWATYSS